MRLITSVSEELRAAGLPDYMELEVREAGEDAVAVIARYALDTVDGIVRDLLHGTVPERERKHLRQLGTIYTTLVESEPDPAALLKEITANR